MSQKTYSLSAEDTEEGTINKLLGLVEIGAASPVIAGTGMYLLVDLASRIPLPGANKQQPAANPPPPPSWFQNLIKTLEAATAFTPLSFVYPILQEGTAGVLSTTLLSAGDALALKAVILTYIASGGNLAGLITSTSSLLTGILKGGT